MLPCPSVCPPVCLYQHTQQQLPVAKHAAIAAASKVVFKSRQHQPTQNQQHATHMVENSK